MRIVEAYKPNTVVEAHCIRQMLEDAGIACKITGEDLASMYGHNTNWNKASILVSEYDLPRVRELIADKLAQSTSKDDQSNRGFQYGMRSLLINFTLIAVTLGFYRAFGRQWPDFAKTSFYFLFWGNALVYAYVLKRRRQTSPPNEDP
jgi:hypothetical protein